MNHPTVTVAGIHNKIKKTDHFIIPGTTVTICSITLENGYSVRGESDCVSPENFNKALGEKYAFEQAFEKIWALEGYLLKQKLFEQTLYL